jgi:cysteine desulfurase
VTAARVGALRDRLEAAILALEPDALVLGAGAARVPHISALVFPGQRSDALLMALDLEGVSASAGSACAAGSLEPSHVVVALGVAASHANGLIRLSLGRETTEGEVDSAARTVGTVISRAVRV